MLAGRTPCCPEGGGRLRDRPHVARMVVAPRQQRMRVGEHSAVVWKRLYFSPFFASFSALGMWIGPPKALEWPKPMSSISTMTMLGAPLGGLTSKRGGALHCGRQAR